MPSSPINALNLYRRFVEPTEQPIEERGSVLPIGEYEDGSVGFAWPGLIAEPVEAWTRGMDNALAGNDAYFSGDQVIRDALSVAGAGMTGALGARLAAKPGISELFDGNPGSKNARIFDPPNRPQRAFDEDYPDVTGRHDAEGRLTLDIDGKPINPDARVVGRQVVGGGDEALTPAELVAISERLFGSRPQVEPKNRIPGKGVGAFTYVPGAERPEYSLFVDRGLLPETSGRVTAHEVGHGIDYLAAGRSGIPDAGIKRELAGVYNTLNNPNRSRDGVEAATWGQPARPQDFGYSGADIPAEHMAEAIRAYLQDPNYLKSEAPDTAARIREYVNTNPRINHALHFNANAPTGAAIPLGTSGGDTDIEPALLDYLRATGLY